MKQSYITAIEVNDSIWNHKTSQKTMVSSAKDNLSSVFSDLSYTLADTTAELFKNVIDVIGMISHEVVKNQVIEVLKSITQSFQNFNPSSYRFQKLTATKNEDESCLIEWHFAKFHIGLSLETCENESYYFLVSVDESIGEYDAKTRRINGDLNAIVNDIVQFVINNA